MLLYEWLPILHCPPMSRMIMLCFEFVERPQHSFRKNYENTRFGKKNTVARFTLTGQGGQFVYMYHQKATLLSQTVLIPHFTSILPSEKVYLK